MHDSHSSADPFAEGAIKLYTALLAAGELDISRRLLENTMNACAAYCRLERGTAENLEEERILCDELLKKSLFWICQVPDDIAREHGGRAFREGLRLLLSVSDGLSRDGLSYPEEAITY